MENTRDEWMLKHAMTRGQQSQRGQNSGYPNVPPTVAFDHNFGSNEIDPTRFNYVGVSQKYDKNAAVQNRRTTQGVLSAWKGEQYH